MHAWSVHVPGSAARMGAGGCLILQGRWAPWAYMVAHMRMDETLQDGCRHEAGVGLRLGLLLPHEEKEGLWHTMCLSHKVMSKLWAWPLEHDPGDPLAQALSGFPSWLACMGPACRLCCMFQEK